MTEITAEQRQQWREEAELREMKRDNQATTQAPASPGASSLEDA